MAADTISRWSILIQSPGINNTQTVESWYSAIPASGTDIRAKANQLGSARAKLLGSGAAVKGIRYATFAESALGGGFGTLTRLSQTIYKPAAGVDWTGFLFQNVSGAARSASMHSAGAHVTRRWTDPNGNNKDVPYSMAFPPLILTRDEVANAQCMTDYTAAQTQYNANLTQYVTFLKALQVLERSVQTGNVYPVVGFTQADPTTNPQTPATVTLSGSGLAAIFPNGTIVSLLSRSHKGKRSLAPELAAKGTRTVINSVPTTNGIILTLSCGFTKQFDPCLAYSVRPHIIQHSTLNNMTYDGYGRPHRGGQKRKKF